MTVPSGDSAPPIRPATAADYDGIVAVWSGGGLPFCPGYRDSREGFCRQLERFPDAYLVATDGDRVVGVVLGSHDERKGWINRLAVLPEYRRRGIAEALTAACEAAIHADGIEIVAVLIEADNSVSHKLFEKLGYRSDIPVRYYRKLTHPDA
ncbi:MAG: GNAT family N-acetyltransferase [Planctomycetota bacterium]